jgi:hypothetical protein
MSLSRIATNARPVRPYHDNGGDYDQIIEARVTVEGDAPQLGRLDIEPDGTTEPTIWHVHDDQRKYHLGRDGCHGQIKALDSESRYSEYSAQDRSAQPAGRNSDPKRQVEVNRQGAANKRAHAHERGLAQVDQSGISCRNLKPHHRDTDHGRHVDHGNKAHAENMRQEHEHDQKKNEAHPLGTGMNVGHIPFIGFEVNTAGK